MTTSQTALPASAEELRDVILGNYDRLAKQLQVVARYVLDHPDDMALLTLTELAERSGAQPSAIVRFAKSLGFSGAAPMQRLLRDSLIAQNSALGYGERVYHFNDTVEDSVALGGIGALIDEFTEGDVLALQNMRAVVGREGLVEAVALIRQARVVHVVGMRRSFPVAAYLAYALPQANKPTMLIDGIGGLVQQQIRAVNDQDLVIAISYHSYAAETIAAVEAAAAAGANVLAISDSLLSPIAKTATHTLLVRESQVRGFRSLSASMCLAQALVVGLVYDQQRPVAQVLDGDAS